jgi:hypothetical protein
VIVYSPEAEPARAYLLRAYNDIDVFVEDTRCQNLYVRLLNRILEPTGKKVTHVFPLHSRKNVIDRCRLDRLTSKRPRLYVIDADQDLILRRPALRLKGLYRLGVYCIENVLLSEHAIVTVATECNTEVSWPDMAVMLSVRPLLEGAVQTLLPLFIAYAIVHKLDLGIVTVAFPVQRLLADQNDARSLSNALIRSRVFGILRAVRAQVSRHGYSRARNSITSNLATDKRERADYISGKTYLLPLVQLHLRRVAGLRDPLDSLKVRLALHSELTIDPGLRRAVLKALKVK